MLWKSHECPSSVIVSFCEKGRPWSPTWTASTFRSNFLTAAALMNYQLAPTARFPQAGAFLLVYLAAGSSPERLLVRCLSSGKSLIT